MAKDCNKHAGQHNVGRRKPLDGIMRGLPKNQSGLNTGRHKCPYCAYELGFEHGLQHAAEKFREMIMK